MPRNVLPISFAICLLAGFAAPRAQAEDAKPACQVAEINPVTGNVICIKPLGAPVEKPSSKLIPTCDPAHRNDPDFSFGPNCKPAGDSGS